MPLIRMKGQRCQHQPGDIFVLQPEGRGVRFGRIVKTGQSGPEGRFPGGLLAYVYDVPAKAEKPDPPMLTLTPDRLLMPPFFTAPWPWTKGYFRTVEHEELKPADLLAQHCFFDPARSAYVDENDKVIAGRTEPCGMFALANFALLENQVDDALAGRLVPALSPEA
ncbi:hypothetical protein QF034_004846 [Streptomyces africanus]|uniref:Immunity protein 26 n=1 Tax=Streptomyces africanus TaxID=231024 RepID=A0ABU0QU33_9ACTN|nr:immunity 26/phosphotriesterase HocA family protein [Streptomyces africanus]MDQ0750615.1 hypothetical protein [Streptomyces africanus]